MPHYKSSDGQVFYFDELPKEGVRTDLTIISDEAVAELNKVEEPVVDILRETLHDLMRPALADQGLSEGEIKTLLEGYP